MIEQKHTNSNELATKTYKSENCHVKVLLCIQYLMVGHFLYLTGKHKKGTRKLTAVKWWDERKGFLLCTIFSVPSTATQITQNPQFLPLSWLLSKPCTYSSSSHLSSIILPFSYLYFFLPSEPFSFLLPRALLPSSFLQCLLCASLPPSASFSFSPFLQNTAGHVDEHMEQPLRGRAQRQYADDPCSAQHKHITQHNSESHLAFFNS